MLQKYDNLLFNKMHIMIKCNVIAPNFSTFMTKKVVI